MPDLALFKPLCEILEITINELLSGEKLNSEKYQEKWEENMVNTIDYSTKRLNSYNQIISLIIIIFGLFIAISAIMIFPTESSWSSIYSVFGIMIFMIGISRILKSLKWFLRLILIIIIFLSSMGILLYTDYINVKNNNEAPMFGLKTTTTGNVIYHDSFFYDVYKCNNGQEKTYWVITKNKNLTTEELIDYCK